MRLGYEMTCERTSQVKCFKIQGRFNPETLKL